MLYEALLIEELEWNMPLLVLLTILVLGYYYTLKKYTAIKLYSKQPLLFILSLALLYLLLGSPLAAAGHLSFSLHMLQMSFLYFIVPPFFLAGIPEQVFINLPLIKKINMRHFQPIQALILFSFLFFLYHVPVMLNFLLQYSSIQKGYLFLLFILSFSLWWSILAPDRTQRLSEEKQKKFLFLSGMILMPACLLFILSGWIGGTQSPFLSQIAAHLCLPPDSDEMNILPSPIPPKYDQMMAGILMLGMHKFGIILSSKISDKREHC